MKKARVRRTQAERRAGTIRKLLDAATETLIDVGYAAASVQTMCRQAGVSQGALFRHFATREALMVAVGEDVGEKTLIHYRRELESKRAAVPVQSDLLRLALRLVRSHCRSRLNQAWYELMMAARTNATLRRAMKPVLARYYIAIERLARQLLPELAAALGDRFALLLDTVVAMFDGEVMHRFVLKNPALDDARLELLVALLGASGL